MRLQHFNRFLLTAFGTTTLVLLIFAGLRWLDIPSGSLIDWVVGIVSFWWLIVILTGPWSIHFQARSVLIEARESREREIPVAEEHIRYAEKWVRRSLMLAVTLHVISAAVLYVLAAAGISDVGYIASAATLLLTGLPPATRAYEYLTQRLNSIGKAVRYPREDVVSLRKDVRELTAQVEQLNKQLDPENSESWASQRQTEIKAMQRQITQAQHEYQRFTKETQQQITQLSVDHRFVENLREIIRYLKSV